MDHRDHRPPTWDDPPDWENDPAGEHDDDESDTFEFEEGPATGRRPRRLSRAIVRLLPLVILTALLVVIAGQPSLAISLRRAAENGPVPVTIVCDVPWAVIRVDGHGDATHCIQSFGGALPMARLAVNPGQHTLVATAEGFKPFPMYIVIHPQTPALYLTQFTLTPEGAVRALDAVNTYLANSFTQDVSFPAAYWRLLGLRAPPAGPSLLVRERFEATALDSYVPTYSETTYQRPIAPLPGMLGVAAVVSEYVTIYDGCSDTPLLERRAAVLYATRASVIFSVRPGKERWSATAPYALNPAADIYTAPISAARPATPQHLLELAARTDLAERLGSLSLLAGALTVTPLTSAAEWSAGILLTLLNGSPQTPHIPGARPGAIWLYIAGQLIALTSPAEALSPDIPAAVTTLKMDDLRAALATRPERACGGE